jgi:cobalt-precorrin 5A hydrolase
MKKAIVTFTDRGEAAAQMLREKLVIFEGAKEYNAHKKKDINGLHKFVKKSFERGRDIVFIGACGIAVRLIAPYLVDKTKDPAVIVMDEHCRHVIPILSGHIGGANELSVKIAEALGADPVITTATDLNGKFAVDNYAKENGLEIENKRDIVEISSRVLTGGRVVIEEELFSRDVYITVEDAKIRLKTKPVILGIGCKSGISFAQIEVYINRLLKDYNININDIGVVATIDIKKNEKGILEWCDEHNKRLLTFTADELMMQKGDFTRSDFVMEMTGTDNVCERAVAAAGGKVIVGKEAKYGIAIAIGRKYEQ